jgi:hypothetical protein
MGNLSVSQKRDIYEPFDRRTSYCAVVLLFPPPPKVWFLKNAVWQNCTLLNFSRMRSFSLARAYRYDASVSDRRTADFGD